MAEKINGAVKSAEHTKRVYEESPYSDPVRDKDMRGKLTDMVNETKMEDARSRAERAATEEKDMFSKISPVSRSGATKDFNQAIADFKKIPQKARDKVAYDQAGYKKGGSIRGCGCETKGKTKGRFV